MRKFNKLIILLISFVFLFIQLKSVNSQIKRVKAWKTSDNLAEIIFKNYVLADTIFPAPELLPENEFSLGKTNTIYWNNDSLHQKYNELNITLIAYEAQAKFNSMELWGYVEPEVDSVTFKNLPEGIPVEYRLRYIATDSTGRYGLSFWSDPEISIPDIRPPKIHSWIISHFQEGEEEKWVVGNTISNLIIASDSLQGKVMYFVLHETSEFINDTLYYDIDNPRLSVEESFPYPIKTPQNEPLAISLWAVDVSEQISLKKTKSFFWMKSDPGMYCFPNPFNPEIGQTTIIKIEKNNIREAHIFDLFGNLVKILKKSLDSYFFEWNGKNGRGDEVATGGYICVIPGQNSLYCKIAVVK